MAMVYENNDINGYSLGELTEKPLEGFTEFIRTVAPEGSVLLRNEGGLLPLPRGTKISLFGRIQTSYYKSGTGSGGMVNVDYVNSILTALKQSDMLEINTELAAVYEGWIKEHPFDKGMGWAQEPWSQVEMPLTDDIVSRAAEFSDTAVIVIGRTAGEDIDNSLTEGSYLLTATEINMIRKVSEAFDKVILLLNIGAVMDLSWMDAYKSIRSVLVLWQGGMEGGNVAEELLTGRAYPSGRLADTILDNIADCSASGNFGDPNRNFYMEDIYVGYRYYETFGTSSVRYPFGYGLGYTSFATEFKKAFNDDGRVYLNAVVTNTGSLPGKEVWQVYAGVPQGLLGQPARRLCGFAKTEELQPGESESVTVSFDIAELASYDDGGITGHKSCYLLEAGAYVIYAGGDVSSAQPVYSFEVGELTVIKQSVEVLAPTEPFKRIHPAVGADGRLVLALRDVPCRTVDPMERRKANLPAELPFTGDTGIRLADVKNGKATAEAFVAQLSDTELISLVRGEGMNSPKVTGGTGCAFGGTTGALREFGIPVCCGTDGPSGIRMDNGAHATAMPNGTLLACTWNLELVEELYVYEGIEMTAYKIDTLLGPGINIHRHPLNGRNFEYFSEDPLLTGRMGAAISRGLNTAGVRCTVKHFIANSQETSRHNADSIVSERALREIYAKPFEIAVSEGDAQTVMTSYNPVNGTYTSSSYDLCTTLLRGDFGFDGFVMTDWWAKVQKEGEAGEMYSLASMIRAQNDIYMVCSMSSRHEDNLEISLKNGYLTRAELQRSAVNLCRYIMNTHSFERFVNNLAEEEGALALKAGSGALTECLVLDNIGVETTVRFFIPKAGKYIARLEYTVLRDGIPAGGRKMAEVEVNGQSAISVASGVRGPVVIYRELNLMGFAANISFDFDPDEFKIDKFIILA